MSITINSTSQFQKILSSSKIVVADFYADWCGPCKFIAPFYENLATKYSKQNRVTFTKINVDSNQDIFRRYGIRAMPTFLIFHSGSIFQTIRGGDESALRKALESVIRSTDSTGPVYSSQGRTLGTTDNKSVRLSKSIDWNEFFNTIVAFFALYFTTLFSLDAFGAGENSQFNINKAHARSSSSDKTKSVRTAVGAGRKLGTMADL